MTRRSRGSLALDFLAVAACGWLVFHLLRTHVGEHYAIPSKSMEPTLHGAADGGDRVLVDKTAFWRTALWSWHRRALARYDLVVLRNRHQAGGPQLVKRFVAAGPAEIALREGDLFVKDGAARSLERDVKHPVEHAALRQTAFVVDPAARAADGGELRGFDRIDGDALVLDARQREDLVVQLLPAAQAERRARKPAVQQLDGWLGTAAAIDTSFLSSRGERLAARRGDPKDVGLELDLELEGGIESLLFVLEAAEVYHAIEYSAAGRLRRSVMGAPVGEELVVPPLPIARAMHLTAGYLDGRFFVLLDGSLVAWFEHAIEMRSPRELQPGEPFTRPEANLLHIGVAGAGRMRVHRVLAFHDVHWQPRVETWRIEPGEVFVLGENSFDSADSRDHADDPFRIDDLVGRPIAILAPRGRRAWL